jgi:hypothetical protein
MAGQMVETLRNIGFLWLALNGVIASVFTGLFLVQRTRERKRVRNSSIAELTAVHRQAKGVAVPDLGKHVVLFDPNVGRVSRRITRL